MAARIAKRLRVSPMAVRQHLAVLRAEGLVEYIQERQKVGRPAHLWSLTPKAHERFPDSHADLAVGLLDAARSTLGEKSLKLLICERTRQQIASYRARVPGSDAPIEERVAALARIRHEEGFMAEWGRARDGTVELIENHCAIGRAAQLCQDLCAGELSLFRAVLGDDVQVEPIENLYSGDRRCAYRVSSKT
jgi:predicted ArsR family transcriptional regulator